MINLKLKEEKWYICSHMHTIGYQLNLKAKVLMFKKNILILTPTVDVRIVMKIV